MGCLMGSTSLPLIITLILILSQCQCEAAIDCRRFVFAPVCRGASAKRAELPQLPHLHDLKFSKRLEPFRRTYQLRSSAEQPLRGDITQEDVMKSILRKYWLGQEGSNGSS